MQPLKIESIKTIKSSDNQQLNIVTGIPQNTFNIYVQPSSVTAIIDYNESNKIGDIVDIDTKKANPLFRITDLNLGDPFEVFGGSDNSGLLWYGKNKDIDAVVPNIQTELANFISKKTKEEVLDNQYDDITNSFASSSFVRWDFRDDTSLIIFYVVEYSQYFNGDSFVDISGPDVVTYLFGSISDDLLCHEIIESIPAKLLKKIKVADLEIDEDGIERTQSYAEEIKVNNKTITTKDNELVLSLSYHLFCSLMNWHESTDKDQEYDESTVCIAKKLKKHHDIIKM